jgi:hypothetical protein
LKYFNVYNEKNLNLTDLLFGQSKNHGINTRRT